MSQLHLCPLAPDSGQVIHSFVRNLDGLFENHPRVVQLFRHLVILGKLDPEGVRLAGRNLRIHRLYGFRVSVDDLQSFISVS